MLLTALANLEARRSLNYPLKVFATLKVFSR